MDAIELTYLACLGLGLAFTILSALTAGVFGGGAEATVDVGSGVDGPVSFPILSPVTISMFVATFGGAGLILDKVLGWPVVYGMPAALAAAVGVAFFTAYLLYKLFRVTQGSSHSTAEEAVGLEAEVTIPLPHVGLGEIAYTVRGARMTNPARTVDGKELPAQTPVKIVKHVAGTYLVEKLK